MSNGEGGQDGAAGQASGPKTYYEALGVGRGAKPEEVNRAHRQKLIEMKRAGQDPWAGRAGMDEAERERRDEELRTLNLARDTLNDPRAKVSYDQELARRARAGKEDMAQVVYNRFWEQTERERAAREAEERRQEAERRQQEQARQAEQEKRQEVMRTRAREAGKKWGGDAARVFYTPEGLQSAQRLADLLGWAGEAKPVFLDQLDEVGAKHFEDRLYKIMPKYYGVRSSGLGRDREIELLAGLVLILEKVQAGRAYLGRKKTVIEDLNYSASDAAKHETHGSYRKGFAARFTKKLEPNSVIVSSAASRPRFRYFLRARFYSLSLLAKECPCPNPPSADTAPIL